MSPVGKRPSALSPRDVWVLEQFAKTSVFEHADFTTSFGFTASKAVMRRYAEQFLPEFKRRNEDVVQAAFYRTLVRLFDRRLLDRDKVRTEGGDQTKQPNWCYLYRITAQGREFITRQVQGAE